MENEKLRRIGKFIFNSIKAYPHFYLFGVQFIEIIMGTKLTESQRKMLNLPVNSTLKLPEAKEE